MGSRGARVADSFAGEDPGDRKIGTGTPPPSVPDLTAKDFAAARTASMIQSMFGLEKAGSRAALIYRWAPAPMVGTSAIPRASFEHGSVEHESRERPTW